MDLPEAEGPSIAIISGEAMKEDISASTVTVKMQSASVITQPTCGAGDSIKPGA